MLLAQYRMTLMKLGRTFGLWSITFHFHLFNFQYTLCTLHIYVKYSSSANNSNASDVKVPRIKNTGCDGRLFVYLQTQLRLGNSEKLNIHLLFDIKGVF